MADLSEPPKPGTVIQCGAWPFEGHEPQEAYFDIQGRRGTGPFRTVESVTTIRGRAVRKDDGTMEVTVL